MLLEKMPVLNLQVDDSQSTPIHYAVSLRDLNMVRLLLQVNASVAHLMDDKGLSAIHIAASKGYTKVIREILRHCPDATELTDGDGNNFLHVAAKKGARAVMIMIKDLNSAGTKFGPRRMDIVMSEDQGCPEEELNRHRKMANNLTIVAVLIATVTFAAAFTLPGGYSNNDSNQGMAILAKKVAFKVFLISDTISMASSMCVTFMLIYSNSLERDRRLSIIITAWNYVQVALGGMLVAFSMGIYVVVVSQCRWLAYLICGMVICAPFIVFMSPGFIQVLNLQVDDSQSAPIHYAVSLRDLKMVHLLLQANATVAYLLDDKGLSAIQIAASKGYTKVIGEILHHCLDAIELTDGDGNNFLHVAAKKGATSMRIMIKKLNSAGTKFGPRRMDIVMSEDQACPEEELDRHKAMANNLAIVVVLIATVTFAAAFTLPGGYNNDCSNQGQGMAILAKKIAFKVFFISDTITMESSMCVTFLLINSSSS
ncbi:hypothetical protein IEQ34_001884 [Dendrobium chrysotoxum]|uniref:PGG domain-containing protein n=1 Tax=Dendrobium chrysotoxum TaxID=161865 RepID=A0AAV7HJT6_DENCH|nr:hypothetical protein IEQ34_001884 [Dendrobium chrysotoxum]